MKSEKKKISVIGGTGNLGYALAWRWARAGHEVTIGSRDAARAQAAAEELNKRLSDNKVCGNDNLSATRAAEVVVLTVPYSAHNDTLESIKPGLAGQIFIETTVPLQPPKVSVVQLPKEGSVAQITATQLGERARTVAAFHNVSAKLLEKDTEIHCDILVTSDDMEARKAVMLLVEDSGCRPMDAGSIANSAAAEALTSILIHLNKTYKVGHAGIQVTGLDK